MAHLFFIILCSVCFLYCYFTESTHAAEHFITVLTQGQTLRDGQVLVSPKGTFTLGFFASDSRPSSESRYLGIKLNTSVVFNPVWVANRDNPISDSNAFLSLDANGILRIERLGKNITILNSNLAASPTSNLTATLLDSGNFVLKEINNAAATTERLLWQSFDYPTDVLLPGMKLSVSNSNSGRNRSLTSRLSNRIPGSGAFTLGLDPNADQLLIQRRGETYWRSGDWDGRRQFRFVPDLTDPNKYFHPAFFPVTVNFIYFSDKDERYFTYNYSHVGYPILIWVLNSMGILRTSGIVDQNAGSSLQTVIECQANGTGSGCEKQNLPSCRTGFEQFQQRRGSMEMEGPPSFGPVWGSESLSDCEIRCRRNCSCIAYAIYDIQRQIGCQFWFKGSRFVDDSGSNVIYVLSFAPDGNKLRSWLWLIILGSFVSALLVLVFLWFFWCRKGKRQENEEDVLLEFGRLSPSHEHGNGVSAQFQLFTYDSIVSATNNFSPKNKLGEGGFGPVYKGKLEEEHEIAVKKLSKSSGQGLNEFKNEIALIAKLQHMNLVRLLGCCIKGEEKMLVYEYMPNKSLDSLLFDPAGRQLLDWRKRINIIEGIAQGLLYLHKYSRLRIIHRDLKASNILLDAEMNPKISDFGMAKIFGHGESTANTNRIVGTYGYMSPEYAMDGIFSVKSDVFSYGVLVLEIVSGRRNTSFYDSDHHINLIGYAWDLWQKRAVMELVDVTLLSSASSEEILLRCVHVGLLCVQESAEDRPTMLDVVSMLSNRTMCLPQPKQPAFSVVRNIAMDENTKGKSQVLSQTGLTMSMVRAR